MNSSHRRQSSNGSFTVSLTNDNNNLLQTSFTSLTNFMNTAKLMEDEIMVPSKLKDKIINHANTTNGYTNGHNLNGNGSHSSSTASLSNGSLAGSMTNGSSSSSSAANGATSGVGGEKEDIDALEYYKFIRLVRNQFLHSKPFSNIDEYFSNNELKNKKFKQIFESLCYHYTELMSSLNMLSDDAKILTDTYRENV